MLSVSRELILEPNIADECFGVERIWTTASCTYTPGVRLELIKIITSIYRVLPRTLGWSGGTRRN